MTMRQHLTQQQIAMVKPQMNSRIAEAVAYWENQILTATSPERKLDAEKKLAQIKATWRSN